MVYFVLYLLKNEQVLLTCSECDLLKWSVGCLPTTHQLQNVFNVQQKNELERCGMNLSWIILRCSLSGQMQLSHDTYVINGEGRERKVVAYVKKLSRFAGSAK
jgi:hypothetical protein